MIDESWVTGYLTGLSQAAVAFGTPDVFHNSDARGRSACAR